jgi:hypothetical protein
MQPADQALVQKYLSATLTKVAAMKKQLSAAKSTLERQEQALYAATKEASPAAVAPVGLPPAAFKLPAPSPSILDGEVDMQQVNNAIQRLVKGCDCPNLQNDSFPTSKEN